MKKVLLIMVLGLTLLLMGMALSASATTILDPSNGETHLFQIFASPQFNAGSYGTSNLLAAHFDGIVGGIVSTLPQSGYYYEITGYYATWAGYTESPGYYKAGDLSTHSAAWFTTTSNQDNYTQLVNPILFAPSYGFGFYDATSGGRTETTQTQNGAGSQSNGLIFSLGNDYYIVAFEDGGSTGSCLPGLGDGDYNDLVLKVHLTDNPVPIPPSALLLGSGILGLVAFRWRRG